jgi:hypothetical protein
MDTDTQPDLKEIGSRLNRVEAVLDRIGVTMERWEREDAESYDIERKHRRRFEAIVLSAVCVLPYLVTILCYLLTR